MRWIRSIVSLSALSVLTSSLLGQAPRDSARLKEIIVTAARTDRSVRLLGSAADALSSTELGNRQVRTLKDALQLIPGTTLISSGGRGSVSSSFFRGTSSNQTLLMIDGIRVNDASVSPASILGGLELNGADRVEVVRGPQGTLYGGSAVGGVIALMTEPGQGRPEWRFSGEAGSFGTARASLGMSGATGRLGLVAGASAITTDNERPSNDFHQRTETARLDFRAASSLALGATFRGQQESFTSPGDIRTTNTTPVGTTSFENNLGTVFVDGKPAGPWSSRLTIGYQQYYLRGTSRFDGGPESISRLRSNRWVADWVHRIKAGSHAQIVAGVNQEWNRVRDGDEDRDERLTAGYGQITVDPMDELSFTGGVRVDHYSTFGTAATGRLTGAYFIRASQTKIRASGGTGFLPPSLASRFGGPFQDASPGIKPERSNGWDFGVDQYVAGGRGSLGATVFGNHIRDLIGFESAPFPALGHAINLARASTSGLELSSRLEVGAVDARLAYTYLHAIDESAPDPAERRLIRRPRHTIAADVAVRASRTIRVGAGGVFEAGREDSDFNVFPFVRLNPGDFLDARVYGAWRVWRSFELEARIENLFDKHYEDAYGFPALGRRAIVGVAVR
ncbi:MAG: TonB-dependent receptor [Gemmatimonadota bacterium]